MEKSNNIIKAIILKNRDVTMSEINNIRIIRIKDKNYNLLIMKDYWPVIGEINGSIYLEGDETYSFENVVGFFSISHNIFHLIIRGEED